jgi:hypothetical protein
VGGLAGASSRDQVAPPIQQRNIALATTTPESINLEEQESRAIARLAPLLTRSPRALKRYLNTYRLLKALVDPQDLPLARVLLAIATGRPAVGDRLFEKAGTRPDATLLSAVVGDLPTADRDWLATYDDTSWQSQSCAAVRPVVAHVCRFVFRADTRPPEVAHPDHV